ncbi:MAG: hydroxymethylbilane synthase, partial [Pseudobdellovibrionaceae bacterium]
MRLRISARKSDLARLQAYQVGDALKNQQPGLEIEYFFKSSLGDINLTDPLWKIPTKGVFTEDFQGELLEGQTDMVVHSWKDLPTEANSKTFIAASLPRADQRDLLLIKKSSFVRLHSSKKMNLFSSSPRRIYNLESFCKTHLPFALQQVDFNSVRGNIPTRLQKTLQATETDGIIVAKAALDRLLSAQQEEFQATRLQLRQDLSKFEFCVLPLSINPNAAAQGSLAVEILRTRTDLEKILNQINDKNSYQTSQKERDILASYGGGCQQKIGISCLQRSYGELSFLKGETQSGQILNEKKLALAQEKKWICLETEL